MAINDSSSHWDEDTSRQFLDYGRYFIPEREKQMQIMVDLLRDFPAPISILELACGEGLLAEMLIQKLPGSTYLGLDGSPLMLEKAGERLSRFTGRYKLDRFELPDSSWRKLSQPVTAVVSSLAIHHLDSEAKKELFQDVFTLLAEGGAFIVADMVEPISVPGRYIAANTWNDVVRRRSLELDGNTQALEFFLRERWNSFTYPDPDDIDFPSPLFDQLKWLEAAGFVDIDIHFFQAGHALFSGWKRNDRDNNGRLLDHD